MASMVLMNDEPIDISEPIDAICRALNLEPSMVARLILDPAELTATVYRPNENGKKHIDLETREAATETRIFKVRT